MKLYEYEAKKLFQEYRIPIPKGKCVSSVNDAITVAKDIGYPVVLKAQVLVGGRGKAGGIKVAYNENELKEKFNQLQNMDIKGEIVREILVEERLDIKKELYLSITVDRSNKKILIMGSTLGGVDIEEVAEKKPSAIIKEEIDPILGVMHFNARYVAKKMNFESKAMFELESIIMNMWNLFLMCDAELVEINPLIITKENTIIAADAKIIIDDNSLFRQEYFNNQAQSRAGEYNIREIAAKKENMTYVELDGEIGIIGNGAGLVMATMDCVKFFGGNPANFLDVGGGASAEQMGKAIKIVSNHPRIKAIFINILGGITRCDDMAKGIVSALQRMDKAFPIVIRLIGTNEQEGKQILRDNGIEAFDDMESAAKRVVEFTKGG